MSDKLVKDEELLDLNLDEDLNFDDLNLDESLKDLETAETETSSLNMENSEESYKSDSDTETETLLDSEKIDELSSDTQLDTSFNSEDESLNLSLDEIDEFDLKTDLGLEDELPISKSETEKENFNLELVDDKGEPIDTTSSEEEYGVDLKSDPETIDTWLDDVSEHIEKEGKNIEDFIDTEIYDKMSKDSEIENIEFPERKEIKIDEEQENFLNSELEELDLDIPIDSSIEEEKDEYSLESFEEIGKEDLEISEKTEEQNLQAEEQNLQESSVAASETDDKEMFKFENIEDNFESLDLDKTDEIELNEKELKIEPFDETLDEDISQNEFIDESVKIEETTDENIKLSELEEELPQETSESLDINLDDFSIEEELVSDKEKTISFDEISEGEIKEESINLDEAIEVKDNSILTIEEEKPEISSTIVSTEEDEEKNFEKSEKISEEKNNIEEDLSLIEEKLFPSSDELLELDEEIKLSELKVDEIEEKEAESITPLPDADVVFTEKKEGFNLSEEESETIDLSSFDAEFKEEEEIKNITEDENNEKLIDELEHMDKDLITDEELAYANLKSEMSKTKENEKIAITDINKLKDDIKEVLLYLDKLLDALPEEKIKEFAKSETFEKYKKLFEDLNLI